MLYVSFVDLDVSVRVQREVFECVMQKNGIPEILFRSMMSLYEGKRT